MQVKLEKKVQENAAPVVQKKIKMFLYDPASDDEPSDYDPKNPDATTSVAAAPDEEAGDGEKKKFGHRIKKGIQKVKERKE